MLEGNSETVMNNKKKKSNLNSFCISILFVASIYNYLIQSKVITEITLQKNIYIQLIISTI